MKLNRSILEKATFNALKNAEELFEDAQILLKNDRLPRAYTLFHLSIEEVGKVFVLYKYLLQNDYSAGNLDKFLSEMRDHKIKINLSTNAKILEAAFTNSQSFDLYKSIINHEYSESEIKELNKLKNDSLYSGFENDKSFLPHEKFSKSKVEEIKIKAESSIKFSIWFNNKFINDLDYYLGVLSEYLSTEVKSSDIIKN